MFGFGKKKEDDGDSPEETENMDDDEQYIEEETKAVSTEDMNIPVEITRLKAQVESLGELRKSTQERFSRVSEQVGELRGMIMDTNKSLQEIEVKVVKAVDMVEAVQPDKLLIEVKRQDAKVEGLSAKIESNRSFIDTLLEDIKDLRRTLTTFKGIEETVKMNNEVKKELNAIERMKATVERHADKAETLFIEIQKKVTDFDQVNAKVKDLDKGFNTVLQDLDVVKVKFSNKADKKEIEDMIDKIDKFEKHYGKVVELLSDQTTDLKDYFKKKIEERFSEAGVIKKMLVDLTKENPKLEEHLATIKTMADEERKREEDEQKEGEGTDDKEGGERDEKNAQQRVAGTKGEKKGFLGMFKGKKQEDAQKSEISGTEGEKIVIPDSIGAGDDKPK